MNNKNIYDFSIKLDNDYYFVNGSIYKRVDIDINNNNIIYKNINNDIINENIIENFTDRQTSLYQAKQIRDAASLARTLNTAKNNTHYKNIISKLTSSSDNCKKYINDRLLIVQKDFESKINKTETISNNFINTSYESIWNDIINNSSECNI